MYNTLNTFEGDEVQSNGRFVGLEVPPELLGAGFLSRMARKTQNVVKQAAPIINAATGTRIASGIAAGIGQARGIIDKGVKIPSKVDFSISIPPVQAIAAAPSQVAAADLQAITKGSPMIDKKILVGGAVAAAVAAVVLFLRKRS